MSKMFGYRGRKKASNGESADPMYKAKDNPPNYEGKEHVRYQNPGFTRHEIRIPEETPHMRSHVTRDEEHEMEDNYHMGVPDQTAKTLQKKIARAKMGMDAPNQQDPKPIRGNPVTNVGYKGEEDTSGIEQMGPHDMQENDMHEQRGHKLPKATKVKKESEYGMEEDYMENDDGEREPKEHRKKMIVAVMKRKMKKRKGSDMSRREEDSQSRRVYSGTRSSEY